MKEYIMIKETGNAPVTVAELIRCKDCKRNAPSLCPMLFTGLFTEMKDEDYCSWFERKDNNGI